MISERDLTLARNVEGGQLSNLSSPEVQTELGKKVFSNITEYLSTHERFSQQSKAHQRAEGRFRHLYGDSNVQLW